jgi:hypothetical protein
MATPLVSAEQLKIVSIRLEADRYNQPLFLAGNGRSGVVVEVNIYEDLSKGFLTGGIVIQDDLDIYRVADLVGTERIVVEFETPDRSSGLITKTFIIEEITDNIKTNDQSSFLSMALIEDIKFYNDLIRFSKAYTGTGEEIISAIAKDKLGREVVIESKVSSFQQAFRYIVPFQDPLSAIYTVLSKMTTETGLPFFFYSSVVDNKFYLTDLQTIIQEKSFNEVMPFVYDQFNTAKSDIESQAVNITNLDLGLLENTLEIALDGGMGSQYNSVNATTGSPFKFHIDMADWFARLTEAELFPKEQNFIAFDKKFIADPLQFDNKSITDYNTKIVTRVTSQPYNDTNGFSQEAYPAAEIYTMIRKSVISHLMKNIYSINMPGLLFGFSIKTCVGHQVRMNVKRNNTDINTNTTIDEKRSGDFVILSKRHCFDIVGERHTVALNLSKLASRSIQE